MKWMKPAVTTIVTLGIMAAGVSPTAAATSAEAVSLQPQPSALVAQVLPDATAEIRPATAEELSRARLADLRTVFPDITAAEALTYTTTSEASMRLVNDLRETFGTVYSYAEVTGGKSAGSIIHLKGASPAVLQVIKLAGVPNVTVLDGAKFSLQEERALNAAVHQSVTALKATKTVDTHYDWNLDQWIVEIQPKDGADFASIVSGLPADTSRFSPLPAGIPASKITYKQIDGVENQVLSGGTALSRVQRTSPSQDIDNWCTASFGVVGLNGVGNNRRGLLTAEHCKTVDLWYEARLRMSKAVPYDGSVKADALFLSTNADSSRRDFIYGKASNGALLTRPVTGSGFPRQGDRVCNFGWTTDDQSIERDKCSTAASFGHDRQSCDGNVCYDWWNQIRTADRITDGGDSGGPWYINNTALGVHSNAQYVAFQYSQFQPISDATRKTGTRLLTS